MRLALGGTTRVCECLPENDMGVCDQRMVRRQSVLPARQRRACKRFGLSVVAFHPEQVREAGSGEHDFAVILTEYLQLDGERLPVERFGLVVPALRIEDSRDVVQGLRDFEVLVAVYAPHDGQRFPVHRLRGRQLLLVAERNGQIVQRTPDTLIIGRNQSAIGLDGLPMQPLGFTVAFRFVQYLAEKAASVSGIDTLAESKPTEQRQRLAQHGFGARVVAAFEQRIAEIEQAPRHARVVGAEHLAAQLEGAPRVCDSHVEDTETLIGRSERRTDSCFNLRLTPKLAADPLARLVQDVDDADVASVARRIRGAQHALQEHVHLLGLACFEVRTIALGGRDARLTDDERDRRRQDCDDERGGGDGGAVATNELAKAIAGRLGLCRHRQTATESSHIVCELDGARVPALGLHT